MKKVLLTGLVGIIAATSAHAGFWDKLGFGQKKEPATLSEACNKDEISKVCPEAVLGDKTVLECLSENVSELSGKCTAFVKKATVGKAEEAKAAIVEKKTAAVAKKDEVVATAEKTKTDAKAVAAEHKAAAKATGAEAKATGKAMADSVKKTGESVKNVFAK